MSNPVSYKGATYSSLKKLVEVKASEGISYAIVATRLKGGWELEKALHEPKNKNLRKIYCVAHKTYSNLKDLAKDAGISYQAAVKRSHRGWTDEEIFHGREKQNKSKPTDVKKTRGQSIFVDGKEYESLRHAFEVLKPKCSYNTLRGRIRYGWRIDEALEVNLKIDGRKAKANSRSIFIGGTSLSIAEASKRYKVPYSTILDRINRGASSEQAVGLESIADSNLIPQSQFYKKGSAREKKTYAVDGVIYKSVAELARAYKKSPALVYNRMRDNGWSPERAVKEHITETVEIQGIEYRSAMNAWEKVGRTTFTTYQGRKSQGLSLEICLGLEPLPSLERYEIDGKTYSSLSEVAKAFGLSHGQLASRLNNMSLEEAVVYKPSNGRFSRQIFLKNPKLANTQGILYFIKVNLSDGVLHKIGITKKETGQRFNSYDFEIIKEVKGKLCALYDLEQLVIRAFSKLHHRAEEEFEGRTETFLLMDDEEKQMLDFIEKQSKDIGSA